MIAWWWGWVLMGIGVLCGAVPAYLLGRWRHAREELREAQRRQLERQRITHDTKRVSVARPGSKPGRVSKATIDMGASHMKQHGREVD